MVMPLDYARPRRYGRPFGEVSPIIDAGNPWDAITQIADFAARHQGFRIGVPDTSFFPFSAICRLRMTFPSGTYSGTGFYIGPGLVLTCGHNLFAKTGDGSGTEAATALTVRPGQQNATTWLDSFDVAPAEWAVHPTWVASGASNRGFDLSVIRVTHAPPGGNYFATINYSPAPETPIAVCGYGGEDVDSDRQHLDIDRVRAVSDDLETFDYNLQTRKGNSGSPVFAHFTDTASEPPQAIPVMGVHVAGHGATLNRGVLLTPDKIDWALGGGISSVSAFSLGAPAPRRTSLGGLPLQRGARGTLGGLPLLPGAGKPMPRTQSYVRPFERAWIVIDQAATGGMSVAWRTFGHPTLDASGKTTLSVRAPNVPAGGKVLWNIPDAAHKARASLESGGAPTDFVTGTSATLRSTAGGPVALDVMVKDSSGATVESNKYWLSSPQFVIVSINATADDLGKLLEEYKGRDQTGMAHAFQKRLAKLIETPWLMATSEDLRYPATEGAAPNWRIRLVQQYIQRIIAIMPDYPEAADVFLHVMNLVQPPTQLFRPSLLVKVLGSLLSKKKTAQNQTAIPAALSQPHS